MRGKFAAACAAVLVGLAPPGTLACAPLPFAAAWTVSASASARTTRGLVAGLPALHDGAVEQLPAFPAAPAAPACSAEEQGAPLIWRSPSGPAPSTAPPAL